MQESASTRARLAKKTVTPEKRKEQKRIKKVERWLSLRKNKNMSAMKAAAKVKEPVANLYRWQKDPSVHSTRPRNLRSSKRTPKLIEAVRKIRMEQGILGKTKIAEILSKEGFDVSASTIGRIITELNIQRHYSSK